MTLNDIRALKKLFARFNTPLETLSLGVKLTEELLSDNKYRVVWSSEYQKFKLRGEKRKNPNAGFYVLLEKEYPDTGFEDISYLREVFEDFNQFLDQQVVMLRKEAEGKTFASFSDDSLLTLCANISALNAWVQENFKVLKTTQQVTGNLADDIKFTLTYEEGIVSLQIQNSEHCYTREWDAGRRLKVQSLLDFLALIWVEVKEEMELRELKFPKQHSSIQEKVQDLSKFLSRVNAVIPVPKTEAIRFNQDKTRYDLIPPEFIREVAEVFTFGANKYSDHNWKGFTPEQQEEIKGSLLRHIYAYLEGEENDPESGLSHLAHAGCNLAFMIYFRNKGGIKC